MLMPLKTDTIYWFLKKTKTIWYYQKKDTQVMLTQQKEIACANVKKQTNKQKKTRQPTEI